MTDWWKSLFQFIIRISLVNVYLAYCYFEKIETNHIVFRQFINQVAVQLCWARRAPVSVISRGHATGRFPSICSMESVKEVFPNLIKGLVDARRKLLVVDNVVQKHITFAGNAPTFQVAKGPNYILGMVLEQNNSVDANTFSWQLHHNKHLQHVVIPSSVKQ